MKQKHIDASREVRLWIGQVIVPAATCVVIALSNEGFRRQVAVMKDKITSKFKKK